MKQLRQKKKKDTIQKDVFQKLLGKPYGNPWKSKNNFTGKKGKIQLVVIKRKGQTTHSKGTTMRRGARFKDEDWWIKSDLSILVPERLCRQALLWQTQKPENSLLMGKEGKVSLSPGREC